MKTLSNIDIKTHRQQGRAKRMFWVLMFTSLIILLVTMLSGCNFRGGGHNSHNWSEGKPISSIKLNAILAYIDANDTQRQAIKKIVDQAKPHMGEFGARHRALHTRFVDLLSADTLDEEALAQLRQQSLALTDSMFDQSIAIMVEISKVITPEQRARLIDHWRKHHG